MHPPQIHKYRPNEVIMTCPCGRQRSYHPNSVVVKNHEGKDTYRCAYCNNKAKARSRKEVARGC